MRNRQQILEYLNSIKSAYDYSEEYQDKQPEYRKVWLSWKDIEAIEGAMDMVRASLSENVVCLCRSCKHFIHRRKGKSGGVRGMCELSRNDNMRWEAGEQLRDPGTRHKCARYEEEEIDVQ